MKKTKLSDVVYVGESSVHGKGLFAKRAIKKGECIGEFKGPETTVDGEHVLWVWGEGRWIGRQGRNSLRYLNHSRRPNSAFHGFSLYALHPVTKSGEILIDYGW